MDRGAYSWLAFIKAAIRGGRPPCPTWEIWILEVQKGRTGGVKRSVDILFCYLPDGRRKTKRAPDAVPCLPSITMGGIPD